MARRNSIEAVIDALQDALDIAEEVADNEPEESERAAAVEAITAIRQGRYDDAVTTLEREFLPKWENKAAAEADYKEAMGNGK